MLRIGEGETVLDIDNLYLGDCLEVMRGLDDCSVDAVITDPPYGLKFMGKKWDCDVPPVEVWEECLRVLKPGGYLLAFAGTRTQHRMACRIEDAGFEIRDMIAWVYGSGFPKSLNVGKAVDALRGNEREMVGQKTRGYTQNCLEGGPLGGTFDVSQGTSEWEGWGSALKPALEPITVARKLLSEKTVAANVLKWGTGGINIDGCRISEEPWAAHDATGLAKVKFFTNGEADVIHKEPHTQGRFPANLIHDGSDEVVGLFPEVAKGRARDRGRHGNTPFSGIDESGAKEGTESWRGHDDDSGSAARFFYCGKASASERNAGCEGLEERPGGSNSKGYTADVANGLDRNRPTKNFHPTVKPIAVMEYLIKLVSREGAVVLDPYMGSGTTAVAAIRLGRHWIGIERDAEYFALASARIQKAQANYQAPLFAGV